MRSRRPHYRSRFPLIFLGFAGILSLPAGSNLSVYIRDFFTLPLIPPLGAREEGSVALGWGLRERKCEEGLGRNKQRRRERPDGATAFRED